MSKLAIVLILLISSSVFATWLYYCSDNPADSWGPGSTIYGVRFTPPQNSGFIDIVRVHCFAQFSGFAVAAPPYFNISLWHVESGSPTTQIIQATYPFSGGSYYDPAWRDFDFNYQWSGGSETEFLIGVEPLHTACGSGSYWNSRISTDDQLTPPNRNWRYYTTISTWSLITSTGDLMIKVEFCSTGVKAASLGRIKSLFQ